jgi:hypothetical protein
MLHASCTCPRRFQEVLGRFCFGQRCFLPLDLLRPAIFDNLNNGPSGEMGYAELHVLESVLPYERALPPRPPCFS